MSIKISVTSNIDLTDLYQQLLLVNDLQRHFTQIYIEKTKDSFTLVYQDYTFYIFSLFITQFNSYSIYTIKIYLTLKDDMYQPLCILDLELPNDNKEEHITTLCNKLHNTLQDYIKKIKGNITMFEANIQNLKGNDLLKYIVEQNQELSLYDIPIKILPASKPGEKAWIVYEYRAIEVRDAIFNPKTKFIDLVISDRLPKIPFEFKNTLECKCTGIKRKKSSNTEDMYEDKS